MGLFFKAHGRKLLLSDAIASSLKSPAYGHTAPLNTAENGRSAVHSEHADALRADLSREGQSAAKSSSTVDATEEPGGDVSCHCLHLHHAFIAHLANQSF